MGHTVVGRLLLGHTLRGKCWVGSTGHYQDSVGDASAGLLGQTPPKSQAATGKCLNTWRAT